MKISHHATSQEAWEWLNEHLIVDNEEIRENGGYIVGTKSMAYDYLLYINQAWVDPEFDFGLMFGYKMQKWTKLLTNYLDINMLDIVKSEVLAREAKKSGNYNVSFLFSNKHASGHGCLVSLIFSRRYTEDNPKIVVNIRASEVTKRLLMDFVLVQRIAEYIYGESQSVSLVVYMANLYLTSEIFVTYNNHKPLSEVLKNPKTKLEKKTLEIFEKFKKPEALNITYKVHLRSVKRVQKVDTPELKACNLKLK